MSAQIVHRDRGPGFTHADSADCGCGPVRVRTAYGPTPGPFRQFDWSAADDGTYDGAEDSSNRHQIGWGATEQEAIADLMEQIEERQ